MGGEEDGIVKERVYMTSEVHMGRKTWRWSRDLITRCIIYSINNSKVNISIPLYAFIYIYIFPRPFF